MMLQKKLPAHLQKTISSCQNHATIKVKLYKAGIKERKCDFFNLSSVRFDVFIDHHVSSASVQIFNADFSSIQEL